MSDSYVPVSFVADELLTSTKMNQMATNGSNFHNGTALGDGIILTRHLGSSANLKIPAGNIDLTTFPWQLTGLYPDFYSSANFNMTAGNSASDTVTLPRAIAAGEKVIVIPTSQTWNTVSLSQPTSGSTLSVTRQCTVTSAFVNYKLSALYYIPH